MILIIGATGVIGRRTVEALLHDGVDVSALTRDPDGAALPPGARVVGGDPSRPETLDGPVLDGVDAMLISPRAAGPGLAELLRLAAARGVRRAVLLSSATVEYPAGEARFAEQFKHAEDLVGDSGLGWTVLRPADFAANALAWAPQVKTSDTVRGAFGGAVTSPVHERDVAEVAAWTLSGAEHSEAVYTLTGPQPLDQHEKVRLIGAAVGRALSFRELPPEQVRRAMLAQGLPEEVPARLLGSLADYAERPGPTTDTVEKLLGRPALTFADWARDNADAFRRRPA